jgi:hypothetical protein
LGGSIVLTEFSINHLEQQLAQGIIKTFHRSWLWGPICGSVFGSAAGAAFGFNWEAGWGTLLTLGIVGSVGLKNFFGHNSCEIHTHPNSLPTLAAWGLVMITMARSLRNR